MKKIILGVIAIVVLAVVGIGAYIYIQSDSLVKAAIEKYGSEVAGAKVSVSSVKLDIPNGKATISGLTVANPSGFNTPTAIKLGEISVALDPGSVSKNPSVIKQILVGAPEVTYELGANGGSNIQAIQDHAKAYVAKVGGGSAPSEPAKPAEDNKPATKLVIDLLAVTSGKVTLASPIPGIAGTAPLADIHLANIGKDSGGATSQQVAEQLLNALSKSVTSAISGLGIGNATKAVTDTVNSVTKGVDPTKALNGLLK